MSHSKLSFVAAKYRLHFERYLPSLTISGSFPGNVLIREAYTSRYLEEARLFLLVNALPSFKFRQKCKFNP